MSGSQPPRGVGQFSLQHAPRQCQRDQAQGGLQPRPLDQLVDVFCGWLAIGLTFHIGTVTEHMEDGRTAVTFDSGTEHRYKQISMYTLKHVSGKGGDPGGVVLGTTEGATAGAAAASSAGTSASSVAAGSSATASSSSAAAASSLSSAASSSTLSK